jgi:hypothetical protein
MTPILWDVHQQKISNTYDPKLRNRPDIGIQWRWVPAILAFAFVWTLGVVKLVEMIYEAL